MKRIVSLFVMALALFLAPAASAFPHLYFWQDTANGPNGGAGFLYGTGSTREYGITCANCHVKGPGTVDASVTPAPAWGTKAGMASYTPGTLYTITVTLLNEVKGVGLGAKNFNGFAATVENQAGQGVGTFNNDDTPGVSTTSCTQLSTVPGAAITLEQNLANKGVTTYLISPNTAGGGCYTVVSVTKADLKVWKFTWRAPAAGTGPVTIYYGVVDGSTGGASSLQNDVKMGTVKLVEGP